MLRAKGPYEPLTHAEGGMRPSNCQPFRPHQKEPLSVLEMVIR